MSKINKPKEKIKTQSWSLWKLGVLGLAASAVVASSFRASKTTDALPTLALVPEQDNPCAAFTFHSLEDNAAETSYVPSTYVPSIGTNDITTFILGEKHDRQSETLSCMDRLVDEAGNKKVTLAFEGFSAKNPVKHYYSTQHETLCGRPNVKCIGWDDAESVKKLEPLANDPRHRDAFNLMLYKTFRDRNIAMINTFLDPNIVETSDYVIVATGTSHIKDDVFRTLMPDNFIPNFLKKSVEKGYITQDEMTKEIGIFMMPDVDNSDTPQPKNSV